jgi:hypothetical protein
MSTITLSCGGNIYISTSFNLLWLNVSCYTLFIGVSIFRPTVWKHFHEAEPVRRLGIPTLLILIPLSLSTSQHSERYILCLMTAIRTATDNSDTYCDWWQRYVLRLMTVIHTVTDDSDTYCDWWQRYIMWLMTAIHTTTDDSKTYCDWWQRYILWLMTAIHTVSSNVVHAPRH